MARRKGQICIVFGKVPDETHFRKDSYSWVDADQAKEYVEKGYAKEYNPEKKEPDKVEEAKPSSDIPEDFPGRDDFIAAGYNDFKDVEEIEDYQSVSGIGDSTEIKIKNYFE